MIEIELPALPFAQRFFRVAVFQQGAERLRIDGRQRQLADLPEQAQHKNLFHRHQIGPLRQLARGNGGQQGVIPEVGVIETGAGTVPVVGDKGDPQHQLAQRTHPQHRDRIMDGHHRARHMPQQSIGRLHHALAQRRIGADQAHQVVVGHLVALGELDDLQRDPLRRGQPAADFQLVEDLLTGFGHATFLLLSHSSTGLRQPLPVIWI